MADAAAPFIIERLTQHHDRKDFASGDEALDRYLASQATQDVRRRVAACFVAVERSTTKVAGFYTIAASSLPLSDLSPEVAKRLPRYPLVPAVRIGRLAVARTHRGKGIGAGMLVDAIARACRADITAYAAVVDAKDDSAVAFYVHHGFVSFVSAPMCLYLPLAEAVGRLGLTDR